jgi:hypothetical protein
VWCELVLYFNVDRVLGFALCFVPSFEESSAVT